jgi:SSS family solute:Na+ symporter
VIAMIVIGAIAPRSKAWELTSGNTIDMTAWKHAKLAGALLVLTVLAIYIFFAK